MEIREFNEWFIWLMVDWKIKYKFLTFDCYERVKVSIENGEKANFRKNCAIFLL